MAWYYEARKTVGKMAELGIKEMTVLEWWIQFGDAYGIPYDITTIKIYEDETFEDWKMMWLNKRVTDDMGAIDVLTDQQTRGFLGENTHTNAISAYNVLHKKIWDISEEGIEQAELRARDEARRKAEAEKPKTYYDNNSSRNYNVGRQEGKEMMTSQCYDAIDNVINGRTSLQPVSTAFPAFYDVTEWVAEGSRPITGTLPANRLGWSRNDHLFRDTEAENWYRIYNEETGKVDYYSAEKIREWINAHDREYVYGKKIPEIIEEAGIKVSQSYSPEMSNREAFFRELLPDDEPRPVIKRVAGHYGMVYRDGGWDENVWIKGRNVWESADDRAEGLNDDQLSVVELTRNLRNAGFIVKVGNRDILVCATNDDGYYIDFKEAMKQFNNKGHDVTGLTFRQEVQMLLSQGTLHTRALDGKEFNIDEVIEAGRLELERAGVKLSRSDYPWQMQKVEDKEDTSKSYWEIREAQNEQAWLDIAESTANMQDKMLTRCCNDVIDKLNKFYESIEAGHVPTRGELLRNEQYRQTILAIQSKLSSEGQQNLTVIKGSMEQIVKTVNISVLTKGMINATVNTEYKGENYSSRVWNNTRTLATRLESTIEDCIIAGRNIQEATVKIEHEFNVAKYQAERLLRTETARVYTRATEDSFASAGIDEVKILVERGACEECAKLKGKTWKRGEQPTLPIHPNCRCALAPVVKARYTRKEK